MYFGELFQTFRDIINCCCMMNFSLFGGLNHLSFVIEYVGFKFNNFFYMHHLIDLTTSVGESLVLVLNMLVLGSINFLYMHHLIDLTTSVGESLVLVCIVRQFITVKCTLLRTWLGDLFLTFEEFTSYFKFKHDWATPFET